MNEAEIIKMHFNIASWHFACWCLSIASLVGIGHLIWPTRITSKQWYAAQACAAGVLLATAWLTMR